MMAPFARSHPFARQTGKPWLWAACAAGLTVALAAPAYAASPRDELLRFVPDDVGFCLVLQDLRGHTTDLIDSPFADQVRRSPLGVAFMAAAEVKQLNKADRDLRQLLGVGWTDVRDDILGDAAAFAYKPGPPGKPELEQGLVLVRARTPEALAGAIENLTRAQKKDGSLKEIQDIEFQGVVYHRRVERKESNYYYVRGPVLLFSSQEEMLRRAIDHDQKADADAEPLLARRLRELGAERAALTLWLNPRAFDADLEDKAAKAADANALVLKRFLVYWKALDGVAVWLALDRDLSVSAAARARTDQLPAPARRFLTEAARPSDLWRAFPDDPLLAYAGRIDAAALFELLGEFQPKDAAAPGAADALTKEFLRDAVLSHVGPDWGFCLTAPPVEEKGWFPRGIFAVRATPGDETAPTDEALLSGVHTAALFGVLAYNHQHPGEPLRLKAVPHDKREIHYLVGDRVFPPGLQPAYALHDGWMLIATTPDAIRRFAVVPSAGPASESVPILRVSFKAWRAYLKERREPLAAALAEKNQLTPEDAAQRLDGLIAGLQFVDRLEISQRATPGQAVVTFTLQTAQPLKK